MDKTHITIVLVMLFEEFIIIFLLGILLLPFLTEALEPAVAGNSGHWGPTHINQADLFTSQQFHDVIAEIIS